mmetsp:Transcript_68695/g.151269  ORF Transcript_68695/g.151269 Transcript_68695/m.151269 type:complete len:285 (+) Transcript_68695:239-1093(+)
MGILHQPIQLLRRLQLIPMQRMLLLIHRNPKRPSLHPKLPHKQLQQHNLLPLPQHQLHQHKIHMHKRIMTTTVSTTPITHRQHNQVTLLQQLQRIRIKPNKHLQPATLRPKHMQLHQLIHPQLHRHLQPMGFHQHNQNILLQHIHRQPIQAILDMILPDHQILMHIMLTIHRLHTQAIHIHHQAIPQHPMLIHPQPMHIHHPTFHTLPLRQIEIGTGSETEIGGHLHPAEIGNDQRPKKDLKRDKKLSLMHGPNCTSTSSIRRAGAYFGSRALILPPEPVAIQM